MRWKKYGLRIERGAGQRAWHKSISSRAAGAVDERAFTPTPEMQAPGVIIRGPMRFRQVIPAPLGSTVIQPVIVHAVLDVNGKVLEAESLQTSNTALSEAALEAVKNNNYASEQDGPPFQREVFVNVQFVPAKQGS